MCNPESSCVDTLEDVHSLKLIIQGHSFTNCEQMSLNSSVLSCLVLEPCPGHCDPHLQSQRSGKSGVHNETGLRKNLSQKDSRALPSVGTKQHQLTHLLSTLTSHLCVVLVCIFLQACRSFPLPCTLKAWALLSSIHWVFIIYFPNWKYSELMVENKYPILCVFHAITKKSATVTGDVCLAIAWTNVWPFSYIFCLKLFFETGSHCVDLPSVGLPEIRVSAMPAKCWAWRDRPLHPAPQHS